MTGRHDAFEEEYTLRLQLVGAEVSREIFADEDGVGKFRCHLFKPDRHCYRSPHGQMGTTPS